MAKRKYTKEEIKQKRKEQRQKEALRCYRFRPLKNFLFWLVGFISAFIILITTIFVGVKFVPLKTFLGDTGEYVSKDISSKSILDAIMDAQEYDMSDFPFIVTALAELEKNPEIAKFVEFDTEKIASLKFDASFSTEISSCVKVVATLDSLGGAGVLNQLGGLDIFHKWDIVPLEELPVDDDCNNIIDKKDGKFVNNPHLYYYKDVSEKYLRAFDNEGKREQASLGLQLYYPNLAQISLLEVTEVITESFGRLGLNSLLTTFGAGSGFEDSLLGEILDGKTIADLEKLSGKDVFISKILPYKDAEKGINNSELYKILLQACGNDLSALDEAQIEELANGLNIDSFNDIDFFSVPVQAFNLDSDTVQILFDAVNGKIENDNKNLQPNESPKPLLTSPSQLTINDLTNIDPNYIKLSSVLKYKDVESGIDNSELYKILLQACGKDLSALNEIQIEELANGLNIDSFNDIDFFGIPVQAFKLDSDTVQILFDAVNGKIENDNKNLKPNESPKPLLTSPSQLTINDLTDIDPNYIKLSSVLKYKDVESGVDNSKLYKILLQACGNDLTVLDDAQIEELAKGLGINAFQSFEEQNITLNTILPVDAVDSQGNPINKALYDILLDMVNANRPAGDKLLATQITISDLSSFDQNSIRLSTILPLSKVVDSQVIAINTELYNILSDIVNGTKMPGDDGYVNKEDITIEHLSKFDYANIKLSTILKLDENAELYSILSDIINGDKNVGDVGYVKPDMFTVSSLSSFDYNKIKLNTVMPRTSDNQALYDILLDVINVGGTNITAEQITISHLKKFDFENVRLSTVLPYEKDVDGEKVPVNTDLYKILLDVVNGDIPSTSSDYVDENEITLKHLSSFEFENIKLNTVLPKTSDNQALYDILLDIVNKGVKQGQEGYMAYDEITVQELSTFSFTDLHLSTILPIEENQSLYDILEDATGIFAQDLTVDDFTNFEISNIHLSTFITANSGNQIMDALLSKNPTIKNLDGAINSLSLYDVYGKKCFVERSGAVDSDMPTYDRFEDFKGHITYVLNQDGEGQYIISESAGLWLVLCFEPAEDSTVINDYSHDYYGCRTIYSVTEMTMQGLQNGASISTSISKATIKELMLMGLVKGSVNRYIYTDTLQSAINKLPNIG